MGASTIKADVLLLGANKDQLVFVQTEAGAGIKPFSGFDADLGNLYSIELKVEEGYRLRSPAVLWEKPGGGWSPEPPRGFEVEVTGPTTLTITDDHREAVSNPGFFSFQLQLETESGDPVAIDPAVVNRPINNV